MHWNEAINAFSDESGHVVDIPFLTSGRQVELWESKGYDLDAVAKRLLLFNKLLDVLADPKSIEAAYALYISVEQDFALSVGIPEDDPDYWKISATRALHKYWR